MGLDVTDDEIDLPGAVTVAEAAAHLGVSTKWITRRVKEGRLHVVGRDGRCLLIGTSPASTRRSSSPLPPTAPYSATRPGEICRIVSGQDSATVTVVGARAARVLDTVLPPDRQAVDGSGWRVPATVLPLLRASMRLRGIRVEVVPI